MSETIRDGIRSRRSIRQFTPEPVAPELLRELVDMARWAPSHCNTQAVRFIVVDDPALRRRLLEHGGARMIERAPQGILVLATDNSDNLAYRPHYQSAAAAIQNLCLYARALALATCWIIHLPRPAVLRRLFGIPRSWDPITYVAVGRPSAEPRPVGRKFGLDEVLAFNRYLWGTDGGRKPYLRIVSRKLYYLLPIWLKHRLDGWVNRRFVRQFDN
ncbi:MAG TPA: nitroreductase family protein [Acidobacteriota bacterium]|nr:nitroreductase family protein [Acidobacteriota bacterium]HQF86726.1 nitroreductase family protein [Acidobacteriota bacterium]HQG90022.1 nitroreductase family protein [Acidobacteriota bacterium]HQK86428.1 nitroreductase family protein [Acidobacteriota bacterium]